MSANAPDHPDRNSAFDLAASSDDAASFVQLLLEHEPSVRAFLRGLLPSWNDVDEVIQEASLVAWKKYAEFEQGTAFGGWFLTIARYEALAHRRGMAKSRLVFADDVWESLADESADSASHQAPQAYRRHLESCLAELRPDQRTLLLKVHTPGVVIRDMATRFGKGEQAFYKVVQRLRQTLSKCVSKSIAAENS